MNIINRFFCVLTSVLLLCLASCSQKPPQALPTHEELQKLILASIKRKQERCALIRLGIENAIAAGNAASFIPPDKYDKNRWRYDPATKEQRAELWVDRYLFSFPHDSMNERFSETYPPTLYYELPEIKPLLEPYCDPDKDDKTFTSPSRLEIDLGLIDHNKRKYHYDSRRKIWFDQYASEKITHDELGLESKVKIVNVYRQETFIPIDGRMQRPDGEYLGIGCTTWEGMPSRILACGTSFVYKDNISVKITFGREYLADWEKIIQTTIQVLDDAYRGKQEIPVSIPDKT